MKINNVYIGNNLDILKTFPDNSIDSVVTDPPYGLGKEPDAIEVLQSWITTGYHEVKGKGFMGKEWDAFVPQPNFWKEIYRVLKPGGYVLSFAGTRTYDWMVMGVRLAGFEIRDMIAWLYGSGFPKSMNVSKAIESTILNGSSNKKDFSKLDGERLERGNWGITKLTKEQGFRGKDYTHETKQVDRLGKLDPKTKEAKQWDGWGTALKPALEPIVMARKPLDGTVAQNVLKHGVGGINIDESRVPFGNETDNRVGTDVKRGDSKKYKYSKDDLEIIKELDDDLDFVWTEETDQFKDLDEFYDFLDDYHFYKPRENTILDFDIFDYEVVILHSEKKKVVPLIETFKNKLNSNSMFGVSDKGVQMYEQDGRFPANVIHDGSDEVVSLFPHTESGKMTSQHQRNTDGSPNGIYGKFDKEHPLSETYGDSGSAARFFYAAKASQEERNFGLYDFEDDIITDGRTKPIDNAFNRGETKRKNIHPTVKPIELMRYLVRLVTPKDGICLDPYLGSGTTAIACEMEKFSWIGIELMPEYAEIAKARIDAVKDYESTLDTKTFIKESIKEDKKEKLGIQNIFDLMEEENDK